MSPLIGCLLVLPFVLLFCLRVYLRRTVLCPIADRLDGKTVIVTGASSGIGREVALECAARGARVVLGCRNVTKAEAVTASIKRKTGNDDVYYIAVDLTSLASVKDFVDVFCRQFQTVDILVNNAAYMGPSSTTKDGFDQCFQVNFLSHFYLTNLLIQRRLHSPTRKRSPPADPTAGHPPAAPPFRIVNVSSDGYVRGRLDWDRMSSSSRDRSTVTPIAAAAVKEEYYFQTYCNSKLALMLFTTEVNFRYSADGIVCLAVHPGAVNTGILSNWPGLFGSILRLASRLLFRSPRDGAQSVVYCVAVADPAVVGRLCGSFVVDCAPRPVATPARAYKDAERLWAVAGELCGLGAEPGLLTGRHREVGSTASSSRQTTSTPK